MILEAIKTAFSLLKGGNDNTGEIVKKAGKRLLGGGALSGGLFFYIIENPEVLEKFESIDPVFSSVVLYGAILISALSSLSGIAMMAIGKAQNIKE